MAEYSTLAAVDLGSNSFRLEIGRVVDDQIYPLDSLRDPVRLAAGLTPDKRLTEEAQQRALETLACFGERLRGLPPEAIRAVGTNTLRVAKNAREFLNRANAVLGSPIEIVAGREEARLIFLGVAHSMPITRDRRLVVDIGGGSTEFIIGSGFEPYKLESLYMGSVNWTLRFFPGGRISRTALKQAELAARVELETIARGFSAGHWQVAVGSSGTAGTLAEIQQLRGWSNGGLTTDGLERLRAELIKVGDVSKLEFPGLRPDRITMLPGGLAIMSAVFSELGVSRMELATGAMRQGILYDLLGRFHHNDMRDATVAQFMKRYQVESRQAQRVEVLALHLLRQLSLDLRTNPEYPLHLLSWAARLHEIGLSVAYSGYHKHSAYILTHADMPGFSKMEQAHLALLVLAHRGNMEKMKGQITDSLDLAMVMALRLAVQLHRSRSDVRLPPMEAHYDGKRFELRLDPGWLVAHPLTVASFSEEVKEWKKLGVGLQIRDLEVVETDEEPAAADGE